MWADLEREVNDEINDPVHRKHRHGSRRTYDIGCKGPLCRKAANDYYRLRNRKRRDAKNPRPVYKPTLQDAVLIQMQKNYEKNRKANGDNF